MNMMLKKWWALFLRVPSGYPFVNEIYSDEINNKQSVMNNIKPESGYALLDILEAR